MLLRLEQLDVGVSGPSLLRGVSLELQRGELLAVSGPSGCGKTTLLRTAVGLIDPLGGTILLDGRSPENIGYPRFRRQVVLVHQKPALLDTTVRANLERPFGYHAVRRPFPAERATALLQEVGLEPERIDQRAWSLSVGQQQRVCLVRALLLEPRVLLLDEPTSALDSGGAAAVEDLIRRLARETGLAALVVAHDRQQPEKWCDRCCDVRPHMAGHIAARQNAAEVVMHAS